MSNKITEESAHKLLDKYIKLQERKVRALESLLQTQIKTSEIKIERFKKLLFKYIDNGKSNN